MKIYSVYILFGQRTCRYAGEYAPEVIASADEFCHEDNPDYLNSEKEKADKTKEFDRTVIVKVDLPFDTVVKVVNPEPPVVAGTITDAPAS
jgi:hypothetical protein